VQPPQGIPTIQEITTAINQTKVLTQEKSWPNTWREYRERVAAIETNEQIIYLDGPIITQNLVTQEQGRQIMRNLHNRGKLCVGVIKDIRQRQQTLRWFSRALQQDEVFFNS